GSASCVCRSGLASKRTSIASSMEYTPSSANSMVAVAAAPHVRLPRAALRARPLATLVVAATLLAVSIPAFYQQTLGTRLSDIPFHFGLDGPSSRFSVYSVLYPLVRGLWKLSADPMVVGWTAMVLLSVAVALKGALTFRVLSKNAERWVLAAAIAIAL